MSAKQPFIDNMRRILHAATSDSVARVIDNDDAMIEAYERELRALGWYTSYDPETDSFRIARFVDPETGKAPAFQ